MIKYLILFLLILIGCRENPVATIKTNNPKIEIDKLFTHKGCSVYRFFDREYHYFADCRGSVSSDKETNDGETNTITDETIPTVK